MATSFAYVPSTKDGLTVTNMDAAMIHILDAEYANTESPVEQEKIYARIEELFEKLTACDLDSLVEQQEEV